MGVTIVTGAAGRIGSAVAAELARRGRRLVLSDLDGDALRTAAAGLGDAAVSVAADLRVDAEVEALVARAAAEQGGIEAVVNGAGVEGPIALTEEADLDAMRHVFDVNVFAIFRVLAGVLPHLKARGGGRIVNVASGAGLGGVAYLCAYSASKHAVVGLTRSVALEVAGHGIAVNAVCPGSVESEMMERIEAGIGRLTGEAASFAASIPAGRYAAPAEIASLVAYLVCDAPVYLTGSALVIDGGLRV